MLILRGYKESHNANIDTREKHNPASCIRVKITAMKFKSGFKTQKLSADVGIARRP